MDTFILVNHSALDNTMAQFAFRTESDVKYLQFGLLNAEDAEDLAKLQPNIHTIHVGFIKDGLVRATARITGDYSETLGLPIDQIPSLTEGDAYEIGFNELSEERTEQGITPVQWAALITAIQGFTSTTIRTVIEAYTKQFTQELLDKLNGIEDEAKDDQTPEEIRDALLGLSDGWLPASAIQGLPVTKLKSVGIFSFRDNISPFAIGYVPPINEKWISHNAPTIQRYGATNNDLGPWQPTQLGNRKSLFITYITSQNQVWIGDTNRRIHKYATNRVFSESITLGDPNLENETYAGGAYNPKTDQLWHIVHYASGKFIYVFNLNGSISFRFDLLGEGEPIAITYVSAPVEEMWVIMNDKKILQFTPQGGYVGTIDASTVDPRIETIGGMEYITNNQLFVSNVADTLIHIFEISQSIT